MQPIGEKVPRWVSNRSHAACGWLAGCGAALLYSQTAQRLCHASEACASGSSRLCIRPASASPPSAPRGRRGSWRVGPWIPVRGRSQGFTASSSASQLGQHGMWRARPDGACLHASLPACPRALFACLRARHWVGPGRSSIREGGRCAMAKYPPHRSGQSLLDS